MTKRDDDELFERMHMGIRNGVRRAVREHKEAGNPIAVWQDGKVVEIPADKIVVAELEAG